MSIAEYKTTNTIEEKLAIIKQFVSNNDGKYVDINPAALGCVYDLYEIIIKSPLELLIQNISQYDSFVSNVEHSSTILLYIGFFIRNNWKKQKLAANEIAVCYYKLAAEFGNVWAMYNVANIYYGMASYKKALKYYKLALDNNHSEYSTICGRLASIHCSIGDKAGSIKYYKMELKSKNSQNSSFASKQSIIRNIASTYKNSLNCHSKAIKYFIMLTENYKEFERHEEFERYAYDEIADSYYMMQNDNSIDKCELSSLISNENHLDRIYLRLASIGRKNKKYEVSLKYYKMALKGKKYELANTKCILYSEMNNNMASLKYLLKCIDFLKLGEPYQLDDNYERIFDSKKNYDGLMYIYSFEGSSGKILKLLNTSNKLDLQKSTGEMLVQYFNNNSNPSNNLIHTFISNIIGPKIELIDLHFGYTIGSKGYKQAKSDFYNKIFSTKLFVSD